MFSNKCVKIIGILSVCAVVVIIAVGIYFTVQPSSGSHPEGDVFPSPPSNSLMGIYREAAVASMGSPCAEFGKEALRKGGSAVDAAITTLLCDGVCVMQNMGVGGGFIMNIYDRVTNKTHTLVARESAPSAAHKAMFVNHSDWSTFGALAAAIPGELKGYQEASNRFGKLHWRELFQPTIQMCKEGVPVSKRMAEIFVREESNLRASPSFVNIILNSTGGRLPKEGEYIKLPELARTLSIVAESPNKAEELYKGSLTKQFVADIQAAGGIITEDDMKNYKVRWEEPYTASLSGGLTLYSAALPGSGILITFMMQLLDGLVQFAYSDLQRSQIIIETFKHAYGRRTDLGDPLFANATVLDKVIKELTDKYTIMSVREKIKLNWTSDDVRYYGGNFVSEDHGTDNIVVLAQDGSAVTVTSTINTLFGSKFVSSSTGILLNNEMDDFSTPGQINFFGLRPSEANFIHPGKMPLSSMSPTIIVDREGSVRLAIGAGGGSRITTQILLASVRNLWFGKNIKEAIDEPRFHHQLLPMTVEYEYGTMQGLVDGWHTIGHTTKAVRLPNFLAELTAIARLGDNLTAFCDWRRPGSVAGF